MGSQVDQIAWQPSTVRSPLLDTIAAEAHCILCSYSGGQEAWLSTSVLGVHLIACIGSGVYMTWIARRITILRASPKLNDA